MAVSGEVMEEVKDFKCPESFVRKNGGFMRDVIHRIKCGYIKWSEASSVLGFQ